MTFRICDALKASISLDRLFSQQKEYNVNLSYRLFRMKEKLMSIENYVMERLKTVFGNDYDIEKFNEQSMTIYNAIMTSEISEDIPLISMEDIVNAENVMLSVDDIENLSIFFSMDGGDK